MIFKRGDRVEVHFYGKVLNSVDGGIRITVEGHKPAWWAVVPEEAAQLCD